jgi:hypothetical protein
MAYLVATLIVGIGLTISAIVHVSQPASVVESPSVDMPAASEDTNPACVAQVTGMVDCRFEESSARWASVDSSKFPNRKARVSLGDKIALQSGLMELTYNTGAKVILQGPTVYEVQSAAGGHLTIGKLTAKLERNERRTKNRGVAAARSRAQSSAPTFTITTPTAIVTDLGTEFGVEVNGSKVTETYVFQGLVEVRPLDGSNKAASPVRLAAQQSIRVPKDQDASSAFLREPMRPETFVRHMPPAGKRVPVAVYSTGVNATTWGGDRHWTIERISNDPHFRPRAAVVSYANPPNWLENLPGRSQWISVNSNGTPVSNNAAYTFRTTFDLKGVRSETMVLNGWFIADSYVRAMRLNGQEVPVPPHRHEPPYDLFRRFAITKGFVDGENVLEIDVENADPGEASPVGLRVELEATARQREE